MKIEALVLALLAFRVADAHSVFTTLFVNDVNQGDGTCVRMPMDPPNATNPVIDLASQNMMCGFDGEKPVGRVCSVPQSAKLSFLFRTWPDGSRGTSIEPSHRGPCAVYMKAQRFAGEWFKIWDEGYDQKTSQWCSEKIIKNGGFLSVKIPRDLLNTYYLVRVELLALHEADKSPPQPQFYIGCAQIYLNTTGTSLPLDTVKIPGHVSIKDPGVLYNIYNSGGPSYQLPGPKRYTSGISPSTTNNPQKKQEDGLLPDDAIMMNANWWGVEIPFYNNEENCGKARSSCYDQLDKCFNTAPPTGSNGCRMWEALCTRIADSCNSPHPVGPIRLVKMVGPANRSDNIPPAEEVDAPMSTKTTTPDVMTTTKLAAGGRLPTSDSSPSSLTIAGENTISISSKTSTMTLICTSAAIPSAVITCSSASTQLSSAYLSSKNGRCGKLHDSTTCFGSGYGKCCSSYDYCGNTVDHCGRTKCQPDFGECGGVSNSVVNSGLLRRKASRYRTGEKIILVG